MEEGYDVVIGKLALMRRKIIMDMKSYTFWSGVLKMIMKQWVNNQLRNNDILWVEGYSRANLQNKKTENNM